MPNSPRSSKIWCRSDANPVSCNWGLTKRTCEMLIDIFQLKFSNKSVNHNQFGLQNDLVNNPKDSDAG
jgi:hypothetical protein